MCAPVHDIMLNAPVPDLDAIEGLLVFFIIIVTIAFLETLHVFLAVTYICPVT